MSTRFTRWRKLVLVLLLVLAGLLIVFWPSFLTETERQMLGSWQYGDSRMTYTFQRNRRFVASFRDGPTRFGRWTAADGNITWFEFDRDTPVIRDLYVRVTRFFKRRTPQTIYTVQFVEQDRMLWRVPPGGTPLPLRRVHTAP